MVKIRLSQVGKRNDRRFRIVVADARKKRDGKTIEVIGFYNPEIKPETIKIKRKRLDYWLSQGAQPTEKVKKLMGEG